MQFRPRAVPRAIPKGAPPRGVGLGEVVAYNKLTPEEQAFFDANNIPAKEQGAFSGDIREFAAKIRAETQLSTDSPVPPNFKMPTMEEKHVEFNDLDAATRQRMIESMELAAKQSAQIKEAAKRQVSNENQGVLQAIKQAETKLEDVGLDNSAELPAQAPAAVNKALPESPSGLTGQTNCPCCGWKLSQKVEVVYDDADKIRFFQCWTVGRRFEKSYSLFAGTVKVRFRTLIDSEYQAVSQQNLIDLKAGRIQESDLGYYETMFRYTSKLAVAEVFIAGAGSSPVPTLADFLKMCGADVPEDPVAAFADSFKDMFPNESTVRMLRRKYDEFRSVVNFFEARMDDDAFWSGIATAGS